MVKISPIHSTTSRPSNKIPTERIRAPIIRQDAFKRMRLIARECKIQNFSSETRPKTIKRSLKEHSQQNTQRSSALNLQFRGSSGP